MLDDFLREDEDATASFLNEVEETPKLVLEDESDTGFLGMTPFQRFVISLMFFFMVVVISAFCLLITGRIGIPF
jgi:hypothetical protein